MQLSGSKPTQTTLPNSFNLFVMSKNIFIASDSISTSFLLSERNSSCPLNQINGISVVFQEYFSKSDGKTIDLTFLLLLLNSFIISDSVLSEYTQDHFIFAMSASLSLSKSSPNSKTNGSIV